MLIDEFDVDLEHEGGLAELRGRRAHPHPARRRGRLRQCSYRTCPTAIP
jgi:hypothetical protein